MTKKLPLPAQTTLKKLGSDISDARRRRRITMELMAERAGYVRTTIAKIEKGDPTVSMGAYICVIFVLGMLDGIKTLIDSNNDLIGQQLDEENLPKRVRLMNTDKKND
jgi:transcriptional regulator with XRE-family HTH domain